MAVELLLHPTPDVIDDRNNVSLPIPRSDLPVARDHPERKVQDCGGTQSADGRDSPRGRVTGKYRQATANRARRRPRSPQRSFWPNS